MKLLDNTVRKLFMSQGWINQGLSRFIRKRREIWERPDERIHWCNSPDGRAIDTDRASPPRWHDRGQTSRAFASQLRLMVAMHRPRRRPDAANDAPTLAGRLLQVDRGSRRASFRISVWANKPGRVADEADAPKAGARVYPDRPPAGAGRRPGCSFFVSPVSRLSQLWVGGLFAAR